MFAALSDWVPPLSVASLFALGLLILYLGTWIVGEDESGLVIKKFGRDLPPGRLIALKGEAGYQADLLPPGWHFGLWRGMYSVSKVPLLTVRPGEIALVVAADGQTIPSERLLGKEVPCRDFQDARAFLNGGGEKGRQLAFLTSGTYRINPALFQTITAFNAEGFGMAPEQLEVYSVAPDRVGIVTTLDGQPITPGDLAGPFVPGHDNFQRGQSFIEHRGRRGLQEQVLLSGSWNLNPWFVRVEQVAMTEIPIGFVGVVVSYVGQEHVDISESQAIRQRAEAQAVATRLSGNAEAEALTVTGAARASAYREGVAALGADGFTAVQLAATFGEHQVKLVPDIALGDKGGGALATALVAHVMRGTLTPQK